MFAEAQSDPSLSEDEFEAQEPRLRTALLKAQYRQLERADRSLLIVVAGIDGAGKGAAINLLNEWMDPRHIQTLAFGAPTFDEQERPPFWRYWNELPAKGKIGIVFGSWYVPLLLEASRKKPRPRRMTAYAEAIDRFEAGLAAEGVQIIKLWYHLSAHAQADRTKMLLSSPETAWQVRPADRKVQKKYDRICYAGRQIIERLNPPHAPWTIIPSADEHVRAVRTAQAVLHALQHRPPAPKAQVFSASGLARRRSPDRLAQLDYHTKIDKDDYESELGLLQGQLARAIRSDAFRNRSLILVFEGQDAAGKGGAIRRVTRALDLRQVDIHPISAPTPDELMHPYLWRFWRHMPRHGRIAIFDRSWYGRVLVERVEGFASSAEWQRAYAEINDFERQQTDHGAIVLKFWLAITPEEQLQRFQERERSPFKNFKITPDDWRNREKWNQYASAANDMLARTDTDHAPWHVIGTNDKRYARIHVLKNIVAALEQTL
ncbi:polyphosphate:AMP phosphotransferase [Bordetella genomosp. 4]|uniref:polyphosphate:AMP phosphotransferase n=1 Tax=Bordetella genomosp. 4 TaxID=463044 RepID=UPI000B9E8F01|nr:polyphosphate:AMP phosphotransferase [Bordetella genomosp. 4]OZI41882.1 polyphosphate:AMP phosphotransferase [Bordetella genomosp. 4]